MQSAIARLVPGLRAGIPVMGHVGFTPQSVNGLGGFRVQGRGDAADQLIADAHPGRAIAVRADVRGDALGVHGEDVGLRGGHLVHVAGGRAAEGGHQVGSGLIGHVCPGEVLGQGGGEPVQGPVVRDQQQDDAARVRELVLAACQ